MKTWLLTTCAAALVTTSLLAPGQAKAKTYDFAIVPKSLNNPYFDLARDGCMAEAKKLGNVKCTYTGPVTQDAAAEVQTVEDLITRGVSGIAISVADEGSIQRVIARARQSGIPVITFDADAPNSARQAYVGTDNATLGKTLAEQLIKAHPTPGSYAIISGGPAAQNLNLRVEGARAVLKAAGWTEVGGSPTFCNDDSALGMQQLNDLATANPGLSAVVMVGGWPLFTENAYTSFYQAHKAAIDGGKLTIVSADTLPAELDELKKGEVAALVGQQPYAMGAKAMQILLALAHGKTVAPIQYVGLDIVTKDNVAQFMTN
ncbi:MAG TPA: sugar-binding protein [Acidocella sp.]|uniref:sugar-binding protein n=1 Tax=Acidocella sp. TaxID=50710 RepID=UPI002B9D881F|nr:sugar-binding protein [Acidocella sp.]HVE22535.1 sugar-binding protein [Acidocella sp.]